MKKSRMNQPLRILTTLQGIMNKIRRYHK